jgi:hypothetical protein
MVSKYFSPSFANEFFVVKFMLGALDLDYFFYRRAFRSQRLREVANRVLAVYFNLI